MRLPSVDGRHLAVGSTLLTQGLLAISGPLALRLLGFEGRGEVAFVMAAVLLVSQVTHGGIPAAWSYVIARNRVAPSSLLHARLLRFAGRAIVMGLLGTIGVAALSALQEPLSDPEASLAICFVAIVGLMHAVLAIAVLQGSQRFARLAVFQLVPSVVYTVGLVVMLVIDHADVVSVMVLYFSGWIIATVWALLGSRRDTEGGEAPPQSELRHFGRRALISSSSPIDNLGIDQLLVAGLLLHAGLGAYTVALAFETAPVILLHAIGLICMPAIARLDDPAAQRRYAFRWIGIGLGLATSGMLLIQLFLEPVMLFAFGPGSESALGPARILVVAGVFLGLRRLVSAMLQGLGRPGVATTCELAGFAVMVIGMFALVPPYGLDGACTAMLAAGFVTATSGAAALGWHTRHGAPTASPATSGPT